MGGNILKKISAIRVHIWDFDGTFYKPNPELFHAVREAEYRTIMERNTWSHERAVSEFYKRRTPSATQTVANICGIKITEAAQQMESYFDRRDYVFKDEKLIDMFQRLKNFTHYILANGTRKRLEETLIVLGIPVNTFVEILTSERVGENKPSEKGFRHILSKTGLPAAAHMMIGDREAVDLIPAKALGMHTCLVWSDTKSKIADVTLSSVYEVPTLW